MSEGPNTGRSIWAVTAGFLFVAAASVSTDQLFHVLGVYPPWGEPFRNGMEPSLALGYRIVYGILGAWLTARLAPWKPMKHVWIQAGVGQVLALLGVIPTMMEPAKYGPLWYPLVLALTVLPTAWLGGQLHLRGRVPA